MTVENGPAPASLPEGERAYSWLFTARLHITRPSDPTQECANIPATVFEDVLARRSDYQNAVLKRLEVLSFSFNPEWSRLLPGDLLSVDGLVVHSNQLRRSSVADWLIHDGLEVDWAPCHGRRDKDPRVLAFLSESAPLEDFVAARADGGPGPSKIRVDCLQPSAPSKKAGRPPRKRPHPDGDGVVAPAAGAAPPPASGAEPPTAGSPSTPPRVAAAAGDSAGPPATLGATPPPPPTTTSPPSTPPPAEAGAGAGPEATRGAVPSPPPTAVPPPIEAAADAGPAAASGAAPHGAVLSTPRADMATPATAPAVAPASFHFSDASLTTIPGKGGRTAGHGAAFLPNRARSVKSSQPRPRNLEDLPQDMEDALTLIRSLKRQLEQEEEKVKKRDAKIEEMRQDTKRLKGKYQKRLSRESSHREQCTTVQACKPAPLVEIKPRPHREPVLKADARPEKSNSARLRGYTPVMEKLVITLPGPTMARNEGGWGYRPYDKKRMFEFTNNMSQSAAHNIATALERDELNRVAVGSVRALLRPTKGTRFRRSLNAKRQAELRPFIRPSAKTMRDRVDPAMMLALLSTLRQKAERATRIILHADGTDFGKYHILGSILAFLYREPVCTDPFGNQTFCTRVERLPLILQQLVNKLGKKIRIRKDGEATGKFWDAEAPRALCDAAAFSGALYLFYEDRMVMKLSIVTDGARDNIGTCAETHPDTDALSGENSPLHLIFFTGQAPVDSWNRMERTGLRKDVDQLFSGEGLKELTQELRRERLAERSKKDLDSKTRKKNSEAAATSISITGDSEEANAAKHGDMPSSDRGESAVDGAALIDETPSETAGSEMVNPGPVLTVSQKNAEPVTIPLTVPGVKSKAPYDKPPPEARHPPRAINRSGPVYRCRGRVQMLRSYAEEILRPWWFTILAMRWAWGWWNAHVAPKRLNKKWYTATCNLPRSEDRQKRFMAKLERLLINNHLRWCTEHLGGEMKEFVLELEITEEQDKDCFTLNMAEQEGNGEVLGQTEIICEQEEIAPKSKKTKFPLHMPILTENELNMGRSSIFSSRRPLRGTDDTEQVKVCRKNGSHFVLTLQRMADRLISTKVNPLRAYPGRDQRVSPEKDQPGRWRRIANAYKCMFHGIHNASKHQFKFFNGGFASQVVAAANVISSQFIRPHLDDAVRHLFDTRPEGINSLTSFYERLRSAIEEQAKRGEGITLEEAASRTKHDWDEGLPETITARDHRWGTLHEVASFFVENEEIITAAVLRRFAHAYSEDDELSAVLSAFAHRGFDPALHPKIQVEDQVSRAFLLLTVPSNKAQLVILRAVNSLFLKPLFASGSANNGCGASIMMGLNSVFRNLLLIWKRAIFVDTNRAGKGWNKWIALGHRTDGSDFVRSKDSLRLLNPECGSKVNKLLGPFGNEHTKKAIAQLLSAFKKIARSTGSVLPHDLQEAYHAARKQKNPALFQKSADASNSFETKMSLLQWFFSVVAEDVVNTIRKVFSLQLFGLEGWIAGLGKQISTKRVWCMSADCDLPFEQSFTHGDPWAQANGVVLKILGEELLETLEHELEGRELLDFFPPLVAVWGEEGMKQLDDFLGLVPARFGQRYDRLEDVGIVVLDYNTGERSYDIQGRTLFPWTVSRSDGRFRILAESFEWCFTTVTDSKSMEQWFSSPALNVRSKGGSSLAHITTLYFRQGWKAAGEDPLGVDDLFYNAAEEVAQKPGWVSVFGVDTCKRELMRKDEKKQNMPAYIKRGSSWKETNTNGDGRTSKYSKPTAGSKVAHERQILVNSICRREGADIPIHRKLQKSRVVDNSIQSLNSRAKNIGDKISIDKEESSMGRANAENSIICDSGEGEASLRAESPMMPDIEGCEIDPESIEGVSIAPQSERSNDPGQIDTAQNIREAVNETESEVLAICDNNPHTEENIRQLKSASSRMETNQIDVQQGNQPEDCLLTIHAELNCGFRTGPWSDDVTQNIWTQQFILDVCNQFEVTDKGYRADIWKNSTVEYNSNACATVTRHFNEKKKLKIDPISFKVETAKHGNVRYFFIAKDTYAGMFIVDIFEVLRPTTKGTRENWKGTMKFRRVWTTQEASTRADREEDSQNGKLGSKHLRLLAQEDARKKEDTYHVGDVEYSGDIRSLIGVVKWFPDMYQTVSELPSGYFPLYPKADFIRVGPHFSQSENC